MNTSLIKIDLGDNYNGAEGKIHIEMINNRLKINKERLVVVEIYDRNDELEKLVEIGNYLMEVYI